MRNTLVTVLALLALLGGLTNVAVAQDRTSGTADLTKGPSVVPGTHRSFAIEVTNTSSPDVLGAQQITPGLIDDQPVPGQQRIDYVSILLPSAAGVTTNPDTHAPPGWTVHVIDRGDLQRLRFQTTSAPIAAGDSVTFAFPTDVAAPAAGDESGTFRVAVSSDGGRTTEPARGDLRTRITVLEVTEMGAVAPAGVVDQSATGGQEIDYAVEVRNHARQTLRVTPTLASDHDGDAVGSVSSAAVPAGRTRTFTFPIALGAVSGERVRTFSGGATASAARSETATRALRVQQAPELSLDPSTFTPRFVRADAPIRYEFSVRADKANPPALTVRTCRLSFADTTAPLEDPLRFGPDGASRTLSFAPTRVLGDHGIHTVRVSCDGVDANDYPVPIELVERDLVTIDHEAPDVSVELDIPAGQTAVKSGDTVRVSGTVEEGAELDFVRLRTDTGQTFRCPSAGSREFDCEVSPRFTEGTTEVLAEVQATDQAGNVGAAASDPAEVDLIDPQLTLARTLSTRQVLVRFDEQNVIRGGCDPAQWTVGDHIVLRVLFSNGDECTTPPRPSDQSGPSGAPSNFRVLVLGDELDDRDETPVVEYARSVIGVLGDDVRDGAANRAATAQLVAQPGILPPSPDLVAVTRTDSVGSAGEREPATKHGNGSKPGTDAYWTNQVGDDLVVEFAGARKGYRAEVVDGSGEAIGEPVTVTDTSGGGSIAVPIGRAERRYMRGLRLINDAGAGDPTYFDVVLDRRPPAIADAVADDDRVIVSFTEALTFGSDFANDWYAWERVPGGREYYQAKRVDTTADNTERVLTVPFENRGPFGGADYVFTSTGPGAARYEDRAGNPLADTHSFAAQRGESAGRGNRTSSDDQGGAAGAGAASTDPTSERTGASASTERLPATGAAIDMAVLVAAMLLGAGVVALASVPPRRVPRTDGRHRLSGGRHRRRRRGFRQAADHTVAVDGDQ